MFNSISGEITYKDRVSIYINTKGIEWDISITEQSSFQFPEVGNEARVFIYMYHREDSMKLFGFATKNERQLFLDLIKVDSVGPKLSLKILSGIKTDRFINALENEDLTTLTSIPGLGKKTAQKIILKLKGKLALSEVNAVHEHKDIITALTGMGFDKKLARESVNKIVEEINVKDYTGENLEREILKRSIKHISKK